MESTQITGPYTTTNTIRGDQTINCTYNNFNSNVSEQDPTGIRLRVNGPEINFVGRSMDLYDLKQFFSATHPSPRSIAVACGMGGIGKTQFVIQFIDENQSKYDNIVWIDSKNDDAIMNSFKILSKDILGIQTINANGNEKDSKSVIEQVLRRLCRRKNLFVYDNVESTKSINFLLAMAPPLGEKPHIVITSRLQKWADGIKVIQLKPWNMAESIEYISKVLKDSKNDSDEDKVNLAGKLQHFPLALRQATAFINNQRDTSGAFKISEYITRYNDNAYKMLDFKYFEECNINPYEETTYTTWTITIEAIQADNLYGNLAITIFNMIAYFVADDIKRDIFVHLTEIDDFNQQVDFEEDLKSAVNLLVKYCMIDIRDNQRIFSIHRLVQDVTKIKLKVSHEEERILKNTLKLVSKMFAAEITHRGIERSILLNCISVFLSALKLPNLMKEFGSLALTILHLLVNNNVYDQAKEFGVKIVKPLIDILGPNDRLSLEIQHYIAKVYMGNSMFAQGLQMNLETFDKRTIHFGAEDIDTLNSQSQVADSYEALGDNESAVRWYKELLEKQKNILEENHPHILETMCKIAFSLKELGRHDAALELYEEVFVKRINLFEPSLIPQLIVQFNIIYILKHVGHREVQLRTHTDFLSHLTEWSVYNRQIPSTLEEKQNLRKGVFFHWSSSKKQFIHTHSPTPVSVFYQYSKSAYELLNHHS